MKYVMKAEMVQGWSFERCHMGKEKIKTKLLWIFASLCQITIINFESSARNTRSIICLLVWSGHWYTFFKYNVPQPAEKAGKQ